MIKNQRSRPSISKTDKNWYSEQEISIMKKAAFDKGFEHFTQTHLKEYSQNVNKVQAKSAEFFILASESCGIEFKQIRLKAVSINTFELIYVMSDTDFTSEETYKKVYDAGLNFIDNNFDSDLCVTFLYMPFSADLNDSEFLLNGYGFTYDPFREVRTT
jgi:hypothetical protein